MSRKASDYGVIAPQDASLAPALTDGGPFMLLFHATSNPDTTTGPRWLRR